MDNAQDNDILPLHALEAGQVAVIEDVAGDTGFISRISATGFTRKAEVTMLRNFRQAPVIVFIRDTQMALGRIEASRIQVRRKPR